MKVKVATADFEHKCCGELLSDKIIPHGYVEVEEFDPERIFDLCNWDCWVEEKPAEVHSDIEWIGHGLIVRDENNKYYLALSTDWLEGDEDTIRQYLRSHMDLDNYWWD